MKKRRGKKRAAREDKVLTVKAKYLLEEDILLFKNDKELRVRKVDKGAKGTRFPHVTAFVQPVGGFANSVLHIGPHHARVTIRRPAL